jgi:C1A family cysteine protease
MDKFKPYLTDFDLLIGESIKKKIQNRSFTYPLIDWGPDRVVSLRHKDTPIKQQWNGTCSSFATIAAIENKLNQQFELSERSLWDFYGVYSLEEALKSASNFYIMEEKYWPQFQPRFDTANKGKGRFKIVLTNYLDNNFDLVLSAIENGNPCVVAMKTPEDLYNGFPQVERTSRVLKGGHAISVSGYKVEGGKGYFLVKNSWGVNNGDKGYQYIDFNLFDNKGYVTFWEIADIFDRGEIQTDFTENDKFLTSIEI